MNTYKSIGRFWVLGAVAMGAALSTASPTLAQGLPAKPGPARTAKMFDLLCLSKLPNLKAIAGLAGANKFETLSAGALKPYQPSVPADEIQGWRFKDFGASYTLVVTRSKPDAAFKSNMPAFANSVSYACTLVLPNRFAKDAVVAAMSKMIGRQRDEAWDQGPMQVHSWTATTKTFFIQAFHYAGKARQNSSLLAATMFVKK